MLYFIVLKLKLLNLSSHFKNIIHIRELESIFVNMTHIRYLVKPEVTIISRLHLTTPFFLLFFADHRATDFTYIKIGGIQLRQDLSCTFRWADWLQTRKDTIGIYMEDA